MTDFDTYSTPAAAQPFSKIFFQNITIEDIVGLDGYPSVAPEGAVQAWEWSKDLPRSKTATALGNEPIPHISDLATAYEEMANAYRLGYRSIYVAYMVEDVSYQYVFTFAKMNLIKLANNYAQPRRDFAELLRYLDSPIVEKLGLGSVVREFRQCLFLEELSGLSITHCPLYKLASLLREEWVEQDVLDALAELEYFKYYARLPPHVRRHSGSAPTHMILPTDFLLDVLQIYRTSGLVGLDEFPAGKLLRCRITHTTVSSISICRIEDNHYTALTFDGASSALKYGDSVHGEIPVGLGELISRVLTTPSLVVPSDIERGAINLQGRDNGGEGSCSLAALNFIQRLLDPSQPPWRGAQSQQFRLIALLNLICFTCIARRRVRLGEGFLTHWARPACPEVAHAIEELGTVSSVLEYSGSCYQDYNLYMPTPLHPIFSFLEQGPALVAGDDGPGRIRGPQFTSGATRR